MNFAPKKQNFKTLRTVLIWGGIIFIAAGIILWPSVARVQKDLHQLQKTPTEEAKREFDASLEATKALVGGIGTIATIAAGVVLYLNYKNAEDKLAHEKEKAQKDAELAESRLITERFSKAVEQLGSEKMEVRIGGIYALERIAKDSPDDHWTVMEVLTAFIRERSPAMKEADSSKTEPLPWHLQPVTEDVQAALTVIGRRKIDQDPKDKVINLSLTKLFKADLSEGKFARANLRAANMEKVNFSEAILTEANLEGSYLPQANLAETNLSGTNLSDANLEGAIDSKSPIGLTEEKFQEAKLCQTKMPDGTICDRDCLEEFRRKII